MDESITELVHNSPHLTTLKLSNCTVLDYPGLIKSESITTLVLTGCGRSRLQDAAVTYIFTSCPNLVSVDLKCQQELSMCQIRGQRLRYLNLSSTTVTDYIVSRMNCPVLNQLNMKRCSKLVCPMFNFPSLQTLKLNRCVNLKSDSFVSLVRNCKNVSELHLDDCTNLTTLAPISTLPSLSVISLFGCAIKRRAVSSFFEKPLPFLKTLGIMSTVDRIVDFGVLHAPNLASVKLHNAVPQSVLDAMLRYCPNLRLLEVFVECKQLRIAHKNLSKVVVTASAQVLAVTLACSKLESIRIVSQPSTMPSLQSFTLACRHPLLTKVRLPYTSHDITDSDLTNLCRAAPTLSYLSLKLWQKLSYPMVRGQVLRSLDFTSCVYLRDEAVTFAVENCPSLQVLQLDNCLSLRCPVIASLTLASVSLLHCVLLSDDCVTELCVKSPHLVFLQLSACFSLRFPVIQGRRLRSLIMDDCVDLDRRCLDNLDVRCPLLGHTADTFVIHETMLHN
eukprot:GILK01012248.1.p1 GENE.GILK01012248.1~~GILK01012248.1.p1  ORF type:complete len:504 (+),score=70.93 GILK01012248.1:1203-2714(+)